MKRLILVAALAFLVPAVAHADPISAFSLFGGNLTQLGTGMTVNTGLVGSNANMTIGNGSDTLTVLGAGTLTVGTNLNNSIATNGNIIFNGNVQLGNNADINNIDSGGNVTLGTDSTVAGYIKAAGKVTLGNNTDVLGNVDAGAAAGVAVQLGTNGSIVGTVTHKVGTTVTFPGSSTIGPDVIGVPATPTAYVPTVLPTPTTFGPVVGGNVGTGVNGVNYGAVGPGSYNAFDFGTNSIVNLSAGTYLFNTWDIGNGSTLNLDLSGGDILLFFTGLVDIGTNLNVNLAGGDASDVYAETKSNWGMGNGGEWFGTIFGSGATSDITYGTNTSLTGALYATRNLVVGNGGELNLLAADYLTPSTAGPSATPEPSSILLLATGLFGLGLALRRRPQS